MQTILFPTDFSDVSRKALTSIKEMQQCGVKKVILLHVVDQRSFEAMERYSDFHEMEQSILEGAREELRAVEQELSASGLETEVRVEVDIPVRKILEVEKEGDVSMIILGSHGKSNLEEMFLGSVSEKVARKCKRPVLIVKRDS